MIAYIIICLILFPVIAVEIMRYFKDSKIRTQGIKTYGLLRSIRATGDPTRHRASRAVLMQFRYLNKDGETVRGMIHTRIDTAMEARLKIGMILPVMYCEDKPFDLAFPRDFDYRMIQEGKSANVGIRTALSRPAK